MARYIADQNQVSFKYESGTYATPSGGNHWVGDVQSHVVDDQMGVIAVRYAGTGDRNVSTFIDGPQDVRGTITYFPNDWKMLMFALGSNVDAGSPSPYTHTLSEVNSASGNAFTSGALNPFISFTMVDEQKGAATGQNFIRTVNGCMVDNISVSASQGEIVNVEVEYVGQVQTYTSGALATVTDPATVPFLWDQVVVYKPSGTALDAVKDMSFSVNNNLQAPHYVNGSRVVSVPFPQSRDYELTLTVDATSEKTKEFYDENLIGGSTFNMMIEINASTGSRDAFIVLSGCKMMDMEAPSAVEGVNEQTLTIRPQTASVVVNDTIELYNPW